MIELLGYILFLPVLAMFLRCFCCGPSCPILSDDFSGSGLGGWDQEAGSWSESSGYASTSSSSAALISTTPHPNSEANIRVIAGVLVATDGDIARVILDYADSSNYWFAEVKAGTGAYLKIFQRSGGSNSEQATVDITQATGGFFLCASISNGNVLSASTNRHMLNVNGTFTNDRWGIGTGTLTGTVSFDSVSAAKVREGCPSCTSECEHCPEGYGPRQFKVVLPSGMVTPDSGTGCSQAECDQTYGTYYLDKNAVNPLRSSPGISTCGYGICQQYDCSTILGSRHALTGIALGLESTSINVYVVGGWQGGLTGTIVFDGDCPSPYGGSYRSTYIQSYVSSIPDCMTIDALQIPFSFFTPNGTAGCEPNPSAYVEISAVL